MGEVRTSAEKLFEKEWPELEQGIRTMSSKIFLPGHDVEDILQEMRIEAYRAAQHYDSSHGSKFSTFVWELCLRKRADLVQKFNTQKRDFTKEAHMPTEMLDWNEDESGQILREQLGNAGKYSQILALKSVDRIGKAILVMFAAGYNISETADQIRKDIDPSVTPNEFYKRLSSLRENSELQDMVNS